MKRVVPIVKVDKGLEGEANGVQLMKPMPDLDKLLARAKAKGIFGTKMRSDQAADRRASGPSWTSSSAIGQQLIAADLVPITSPRWTSRPDKA